jgi:hypothetical protein
MLQVARVAGVLGMVVVTLAQPSWSDDAVAVAEETIVPPITFDMIDLAGKLHQLGENDKHRARAYVFVSTECPIANTYTKTLNELHDSLRNAERPVDLFAVVSDPTTTRGKAAQHYAEFAAKFPVLFDASGELAAALGPTHTPEAFVLDGRGRLVYRGKIDDAYQDLGKRRPKVTQTYLADAIDAAVSGTAPETQQTTPVGCIFETLPASDATAHVTYNRHIAPIVHSRCVSCHRPGQVAPFSLTTYEDAAKRADQLALVTGERIMPPWKPLPGHVKFVAERWLTDRQLALFKTWAESGRAEGDPADLPPLPEFAEGWRLGEPDLVLTMLEPFTVPADGPDIFQHFVIPIDIPEDKLVGAFEFRPGNNRVVHHAISYLDSQGIGRKKDAATPEPGYHSFGGPGFAPSGSIGGWSVGNTPRWLPNEMGRYLKQGSDLVMEVHYHPSGKEEVDQSSIGIYYVDKPIQQSLSEPRKLVRAIWMANYEIDIAPGQSDFRRETSYTLPKEVTMVGIVPHMHLLGKTMKVTATLPDQSQKTLVEVVDWDFNWQDEYYYERPFVLPAGTRIDCVATYDNSAENPANPSSPPQRVTYGEETTDEMMFCFFLLTADKPDDLNAVVWDAIAHDLRQPRPKVEAE